MWAINFGGATAGVSKELLDLGQCFSSLLLSLHQFFFFFFWLHSLSLESCAEKMGSGWGRGPEGGGRVVPPAWHLPSAHYLQGLLGGEVVSALKAACRTPHSSCADGTRGWRGGSIWERSWVSLGRGFCFLLFLLDR